MDLRERLRLIHKDKGLTPLPRKVPLAILEGEEEGNEKGVFFLRKRSFSLQDEYQGYSLDQAAKILDSSLFALGEDLEGIRREDLLFLDTETTGLAGGTGTLAFMVGIGYFRKKLFHVKQFLIRDFYEEEALLFSLKRDLGSFKVLISFNGKSFDIPLLEDRFTLSRLFFSFQDILHLDLLYLARSLYKARIGGCSLLELEERILGFSRPQDLLGALVPTFYFNYLQSGNGQFLQPIFRHNEWDILGMFLLTSIMARTLTHPEKVEDGFDLYSLGKIFEKKGDIEGAVSLYGRALEANLSSHLHFLIQKNLSIIYKREGQFTAALKIWEEMVAHETLSLFPYLELAKYHEHRSKDLAKAFYFTNLALRQFYKRRIISKEGVKEDLLHRLERIHKKQDREKGNS